MNQLAMYLVTTVRKTISRVSLSPKCHEKDTQAVFSLPITQTAQLKQTFTGNETLKPKRKLKLIPFIKKS